MSCITKIFILLSFLWLQSAKENLLMVLETFRHGAREPIYGWWNAKDSKHWGELTPVGMRQHYNLGRALRKIYIEENQFLSPNFNPEEMFVQSTDVNRTIVSVLSQLYGFYPLGSGPKLPEGLNTSFEEPPFAYLEKTKETDFGLPFAFQPIPVHSIPYNQDFMLRSWDFSICNVSQDIYKQIQNSDVYKQMNVDYKQTLEEVGNMLNLTKTQIEHLTINDVSDIYDVFMTDIWSNKPLPQNISKELWTNMTVIYNFVIYYYLGGINEISRFYSTPFFREIIKSFDAKLANPKNPLKWKTYSAHDWTVATFTTALNLTNYQCTEELIRTGKTNAINCFLFPDYATNLLFELSEEDGQNYIRIRYNGNYVNLCERQEKKCIYEEFRERLTNNLVDFESICNRNSFYENKKRIAFLGWN